MISQVHTFDRRVIFGGGGSCWQDITAASHLCEHVFWSKLRQEPSLQGALWGGVGGGVMARVVPAHTRASIVVVPWLVSSRNPSGCSCLAVHVILFYY